MSEARNLGISLSRGNYLFFMDPDDFVSEDFFEKIFPNLNDKWDVLCFGYNEIKENKDTILSCRPHLYTRCGLLGKNEFRNEFIAVSYTHLRAHETRHDLVCRLLLEKKKKKNT